MDVQLKWQGNDRGFKFLKGRTFEPIICENLNILKESYKMIVRIFNNKG